MKTTVFIWDMTMVQESESQNHRIVGVGRDLWGRSSPTPPPKQHQLEQVRQDHVQAGFEHLQRRRVHVL